MKYLMIFSSTAHAIKAETTLVNEGIEVKVRAIPNEISAGCGLSIHFNDLSSVKSAIEKNKLTYSGIYIINNDTFSLLDNV